VKHGTLRPNTDRRVGGPTRRKISQSERNLGLLVRQVERKLRVYGTSTHHNRTDPLEELVFIILSAQTESYLYRQTFKDLRRRYTSWRSLLFARVSDIAIVIKRGGLAQKKARQLKSALVKIKTDTGRLSLRFLSRHSDDYIKRYLMSLSGIGNKSAACIMLYSLDRQVFPVDTHVWRIARRLGLATDTPKPTRLQELELESIVPRHLRYSLHVNMVSHGQQTCTTYFPKCSQCVLKEICPSRNVPDQTWGRWKQPSGVWARALITNEPTYRKDVL
jgi:endonuclease III